MIFFSGKSMINFVKIHSRFLQYWKIVKRRGIDLSNLEVFVGTSHVYDCLETEWKKNNWYINELQFLVPAMCYLPEDINPNKFSSTDFLYLDQLKNYYIEND